MKPFPVTFLAARRLARRSDERGQALLEFAFMLPVLVLFILGMVDFALLFMRYQAITDAAREGARLAVIYNEVETGQTQAVADAQQDSVIIAAIRERLNRYGMDGNGADASEVYAQDCASAPAMSTGTPSTIIIYGCGWRDARSKPAKVGIRVPNDLYFVGSFAGWATGDRIVTLSTSVTMRNE